MGSEMCIRDRPTGFSYVTGTISGGDTQTESDPAGNGLEWTISTLAVGQSETLTFSATVNATPMTIAAMTNTATVTATANQFESVRANNTAFVAIRPKALALSKLADASGLSTLPVAGDPITYAITATNEGLLPLTGVVLTDSIIAASDLTLISGDADNNDQLDTGEVWEWQGSYLLTQADLDNNGGGDGDIDNTVTLQTLSLIHI